MMPMRAPNPAPISALDKISKRFGAIMIADAIGLALAERFGWRVFPLERRVVLDEGSAARK